MQPTLLGAFKYIVERVVREQPEAAHRYRHNHRPRSWVLGLCLALGSHFPVGAQAALIARTLSTSPDLALVTSIFSPCAFSRLYICYL